MGRLEVLEPRVLLNADAETGGYLLPPPAAIFFMVPPPRSEVAVGGDSTTGGSTGPPTPGSEVDSTAAQTFLPPSTALDSINGPIAPALKTQLSAIRDAIHPAGIFLQDAAGDSKSSDDVALDAAGTGLFAPQGANTTFVSTEEVSTGPPSPAELETLPKVPWTRSYSYSGSIEADQDSVALRIPVGPTTQTLTLDVRPGIDGQLSTPKIDQLYLIGSHGEMLAAISGVKFMSNGTEQILYVSIHGAPVGGELFMRLVRGDDEAPIYSDGGDGSDLSSNVQIPSSWGSANYEISILRTDVVSNSGASTGAASGGSSYITTLPTTNDGATSSGASSSYMPGTAASKPEGAEASQVGEEVPSDESVVELNRLEEEAPPVYLGPLVSRAAAPLGPVLATYAGDPAPPVSRADRPSGDVLDALGADLDLDLLLNLRSRRAVGRAADGQGDSLIVADLRGGGGAPILLSGDRPIDARTEAMALAASLDREAEQDELMSDAVEAPPRDRKAEVARAGLATRAVGFLIGLGLASGPLYPDLVALARRKLLRRSKSLRRKATRRGGS